MTSNTFKRFRRIVSREDPYMDHEKYWKKGYEFSGFIHGDVVAEDDTARVHLLSSVEEISNDQQN